MRKALPPTRRCCITSICRRPSSRARACPTTPAGGHVVHNLPLAPRHFRTQDLPGGGDLVLGRQLLLGNDDVRIYYAAADTPSDLYRNSTGDELIYFQTGSARFESVYGTIDAGPGDYVLVRQARFTGGSR